jgi:hypothetical protein
MDSYCKPKGYLMAYVPDQAIDLMNTIPGAAFKIFVYLCKRADNEGVCFPSLKLIAQETGHIYSYASEMRAKLIAEGWLEYDDSGRVQLLLGFKVALPVRKSVSEKPNKVSEKPKNPSENPKLSDDENSEKPKDNSEKPKPISEKPNFTNPVSILSEPAHLTNPINQPIRGKPRTRAPAKEKDPRSGHKAIQAIRQITNRYPSELLYDEIIESVGESPDEVKLKKCATEWVKKGYNIFNFAWVTDWYRNGIPERGGNGKIQQDDSETSKSGKYAHLGK